MSNVTVTEVEQKAIESLRRLAKKWPDDLVLYSWSGGLHVMKRGDDGRLCMVQSISGITNDGGDPGELEVDQTPDIDWK